MPNTTTNLVLKKPKTESSIRKVWIPKTLAYILREWKTTRDEFKDFLGQDDYDYNLVVTFPNGRPVENRIIEKDSGNKLKLNHGDLKATQGDTGHSQINMITDVYAHILDKDRKINATEIAPVSSISVRKPLSETQLTIRCWELWQSPSWQPSIFLPAA